MRRNLALAILGVLAVSSLSVAQNGPTPSPIRWRADLGKAARAEHPRPAVALRELVPARESKRVFVRFDRALSEHAREVWAAAGLELEAYLGANGWFARADGSQLERFAFERLPGLVDVAELELEWKLHPQLVAGATPSWTRVPTAEGGELCAVYVALHAGADLEFDGARVVREIGGRVVDRIESVHGLVCEVPRAQVEALAMSDGVQWVEPALPKFEGTSLSGSVPNDSNRVITQANIVHAPPYNLDGQGVGVLIYDGGIARSSHQDFSGRLTSRDNSNLSNHATHVAGTVGGDGSASSGQFLGMAPGCTLQSYGF